MSNIQEFLAAVKNFQYRVDNTSCDDTRKIDKIRQLYTILIVRVSDETKVQFTSLFARLSYLISSNDIPYKESYILHAFRKREDLKKNIDNELKTGTTAVRILLSYCLHQEQDLSEVHDVFTTINDGRNFQRHSFEREIRVQLKSIDISNKRVEAQCHDEPFDIVIIAYDRPDRNEDYTELIETLSLHNLLPLKANLVDVEIDEQGVLYPSSIVFEPDYMYDVTAVSECFGPFANHATGYLLRKFLKKAVSNPIIIGNLSNYFLDELVYRPTATFREFKNQIFVKDPLSLSLLSDQEVREMMVILEMHFEHIKKVVLHSFPKININKNNCQVEPSFYSSKYGIQGRLDLFSVNDVGATIIELKSGSTFRPNSYGLSNNHYHQTLIYDLLIESVYGIKMKRNNFILYSKERTNQLRFAPALRAEQREAIKERNHLYIHDRLLQSCDDFVVYYQDYAEKNSRNIKGFMRTDLENFLKSFKNLDAIEKSYCNLLLRFTIRELFINKLGNEGSEKSNGLASLWLQDLEVKKDQFNVINHLEVLVNGANTDEPFLKLRTTDETAQLSNFRVGDLGILYPFHDSKDAILRNQVFKVTILYLGEEEVLLRLRSRQENAKIFDAHKFWHIEHDTLENGYYEMSRSIYEFAQSDPTFRHLILSRRPPEANKREYVQSGNHLTKEQSDIFSQIINAKEYYLLWGPPGTGKTSIMLKELAHHYIHFKGDRILLLAYTNRAVDEICEALAAIDPTPEFIRIGSRYSTDPKFHPYLLEEQIADLRDRKSLCEKLIKMKVYVGTIASVTGKVSLFNLVNFDIAIIDEASQILETSLVGLLSRVKKFVLIGDHLQLPAVVQQNDSLTIVEDEELLELGIRQFSCSLFERMYLTALNNKWKHAIGQLTYQGRMHVDIMSFVNHHFYKNQLRHFTSIERLCAPSFFGNSDSGLHRISFFSTKVDLESESIKVNQHEADTVVRICKNILTMCRQSEIDITENTIGVITPYRAQISAIRRELRQLHLDDASKITIDTVERYQGGSRDIIIMSACMNYSFQLSALVSPAENGVDRKLNVAITRAKEHFILVGNKAVLSQNDVYRQLIESASEDEAFII